MGSWTEKRRFREAVGQKNLLHFDSLFRCFSQADSERFFKALFQALETDLARILGVFWTPFSDVFEPKYANVCFCWEGLWLQSPPFPRDSGGTLFSIRSCIIVYNILRGVREHDFTGFGANLQPQQAPRWPLLATILAIISRADFRRFSGPSGAEGTSQNPSPGDLFEAT